MNVLLMELEAGFFLVPVFYLDCSHEWNPEEMAGNMVLLGANKIKQPVQVKVYRTSVEHFAVVYPTKKVCRPLGVLNLKNTMVEKLPTWRQNYGFTVRQCGFDTPLCSLTFFSESGNQLDRWIDAFTCRNSSIAHTSSLPIVQEDDEL
ncbi:hypothetical protein RUM44_007758 [Polyplax serrata]|uniref:PH domain-containing protein n=1 Tax=Polyplax serrata TaxID=468196 RepID=A0ABR1B766_POLSC